MSFDVIMHLQIVNRAVRHPSPASLAIAHTFVSAPHSARSCLRNNLATTSAFPRTFFRSAHTVGTSQATAALSQNPLYLKLSTSAVSTVLCERGRSVLQNSQVLVLRLRQAFWLFCCGCKQERYHILLSFALTLLYSVSISIPFYLFGCNVTYYLPLPFEAPIHRLRSAPQDI